jgi:hypothetical protein
MRNVLLSTAVLPFAALVASVLPAAAQTVIERQVVITEREVPSSTVIERRYREAPTVRYYRAPRDSGTVTTGTGYLHVADQGDCSWLRRRAEDSDSRYWWERYRACRDDD